MILPPAGVRLVLASGSPRRSALLAAVGLDVEVRSPDVDESVVAGESPERYVVRLARQKARTAAAPGAVVIAADTTVEVDGCVLGKPTDDGDARRMLRLLSGRTHRVHTGIAVTGRGRELDGLVTTAVRFVALSDEIVEWYVATGEPMDKAGGYALQGAGGALVARIDGSVSNVIGLPLAETLDLLRAVLAAPSP